MRGQLRALNLDENAVNVFTDGSSLPTPPRGGVGIPIVVVDSDGDEVVYDHDAPGRQGGTNQEMELLACVEALRLLGGRHSPVDLTCFSKVVLYTDSTYVADNFLQARYTWPTTRWHTRDGNPVVNAKLWKNLVAAAAKVGKRVEIRWYKGHSAANPHNKAADRMAKASARGPLREPVSHSRVRRKLTTKTTETGSICAEGQRLMLRVVTDRWLPVQKTYRYKCEVMSADSPYFGNVDDLFSDIMLNAGHAYDVRLNDAPTRPRILALYGEVESTPA
jgi:ribonuclease HI